jgi:hypothetical protein
VAFFQVERRQFKGWPVDGSAASATGPPFRKGDAAVRIFVTVGNETECCISGSSGIQTVRLR